MTLVHVYGCTVLCTQSEKKVMMKSYDSIMGRTTDSLIGPQPVTLELKNLDKPQPGTISILEGYTVTDKADGDRAQVFVTDGKAYLIDNRLNVTIIGGMRRKLEGVVLTVSSSLRHRTIYLRVCTQYSTSLLCPATWLAYLFSQDRETTVSRRRRRLSTCSNDDAHRHDEAGSEDVRGSRS
jgi:hypothetical protein